MSFIRTIQHLLPDGNAWRITTAKTLRNFFEGLAEGVPTAVRTFVDEVWEDLFPATTRELAEWELQFGINAATLEADRRTELAAVWSAQGGQSPSYLQTLLQDAGFPVWVHEWWESGPPWVARDPRIYTVQPITGTVQCGESDAQCGESGAACNDLLVNDPGYLVNGNLMHGAPPLISDDPDTWPYFFYLGGETFPDLAVVPAERRTEFERLVLKYRPAQQWVVELIDSLTFPFPTNYPELVAWWHQDSETTLSDPAVDAVSAWTLARVTISTPALTPPAGGGGTVYRINEVADFFPPTNTHYAEDTTLTGALIGPFEAYVWISPVLRDYVRISFSNVENMTVDVTLNTRTITATAGLILAEIVDTDDTDGFTWTRFHVRGETTIAAPQIRVQLRGQTGSHSIGYAGVNADAVNVYEPLVIQPRIVDATAHGDGLYVASQSTLGKRPLVIPEWSSLAWGDDGLVCWLFDGTDDALFADALATGFDFRGSDWTIIRLVEFTAAAADFHTTDSIGASGGPAVRDTTRNVSGEIRTRWVDNDLSGNVYTHQNILSDTPYTIATVQTGASHAIYLDAVKFASDPRTNDVSGVGILNQFTIGARRLSSEDSWAPIKFRELAVFNRVMTQQEIRWISNGMRQRAGLDPL